jgi:hypothetical protein
MFEAARRINAVRPRRRIPALIAAIVLSQIATLLGVSIAFTQNYLSGRSTRAARRSLRRQP